MGWRKAFREGICPQFSTAGLEALATALRENDRRLIQGTMTSPPRLMSTRDWPCEAACATALPGWLGDGLQTVQEVGDAAYAIWCNIKADFRDEYFAFVSWYDSTPREEMRPALLAEVEAEIQRRKEGVAHADTGNG